MVIKIPNSSRPEKSEKYQAIMKLTVKHVLNAGIALLAIIGKLERCCIDQVFHFGLRKQINSSQVFQGKSTLRVK